MSTSSDPSSGYPEFTILGLMQHATGRRAAEQFLAQAAARVAQADCAGSLLAERRLDDSRIGKRRELAAQAAHRQAGLLRQLRERPRAPGRLVLGAPQLR